MNTAARQPSPRLRPYIARYAGYRFDDAPASGHAGLPSRHLTLVVSLGSRITVSGLAGAGSYQTLVAGLHATPTWIEGPAKPFGVRVLLTPWGARALLAASGAELSGRIVDASDLLGAWGESLVERLGEATSWEQRFAMLDTLFESRLLETRRPGRRLKGAWDRLLDSHGARPIAEIAAELGWSRRHMAQVFADEIGLSPKTIARIARYERAGRLIREGGDLAGVAAESGYVDQAHMGRDWVAMAGSSPGAWIRRELPFLQDYEVGGGYPS